MLNSIFKLKVFMTIERYLSVRFKKWRTNYFNSKHAVILSSVIGFVIFLKSLGLGFNLLLEGKKELQANRSVNCLEMNAYSYWFKVNF